MPDKFLSALLDLAPSRAALFAVVVADCLCMGSCLILFLWPGAIDRGILTVAFLGVATSAPMVAIFAAIILFRMHFGTISGAFRAARAGPSGLTQPDNKDAETYPGEVDIGAAVFGASFAHLVLVLAAVFGTALFGFDRITPHPVPRVYVFAFLFSGHVMAVVTVLFTSRQNRFLVALYFALAIGYAIKLIEHMHYGTLL